jgi:formate C-acetyltransferase
MIKVIGKDIRPIPEKKLKELYELVLQLNAQHYQNIVLAGVGENGEEITNEVTYLVLDILEELGISDFPTTVRVSRRTDERLLRRVAEVMRYGGGILAVYGEDTVLDALVRSGYPLREARKFANDGCWEVQIPGKTFFIYSPFDSLRILQEKTLQGYDGTVSFADFEELYQKYTVDLHAAVEKIFLRRLSQFEEGAAANGWKWKEQTPCTVISLFEEGCIEKGLSYLEGGPIYNLHSPHIGGLADTVNSLYAVKRLVFDDKKLTLGEFLRILKNNWEGDELLRQYVLNKYTYYGNDNDEVDAIAARLLSDFSDICASFNGRCGYSFPAGVSTFGRQLEWAPSRVATPSGRRAGEVLAANCSPTPGTDREGATAIIRSYCKIDHRKLASGAALDIRLLPSSVEGEDGLEALVSLIRGFVELGGFFMQPDIADVSVLREAQEHPEDYSTLSVRVSGWNARFVTLNREWQEMVIRQNEHG